MKFTIEQNPAANNGWEVWANRSDGVAYRIAWFPSEQEAEAHAYAARCTKEGREV